MDIKNELDEFKKYLINNIKVSNNTAYNYCLDLKQFLNWLNDEDIIEGTIEEYKFDIINDYSIKTINRKTNSLNAYLKFKGINLHIKSEKIQNQTFIDDMLSNEEAKKILKSIKEHQDKGTYQSKLSARRAEALFLGLFYTGARVSELLQIRPKHIEKNEITIKGKGSKYRKILIPNRLTESFIFYATYGRVDSGDLLFTGQRGNLSRSTVFREIKKYAKLAGVNEDKVYPHAIRHLYTKNLAQKNVSYSAIKQLLGHSLSTTDIYMQLSKNELLDIINSISID